MENKNNTERFVKITQSKEEINDKKNINLNYKIQVEDMNLLEMFNASMFLLETIIKRLKSEDTSLTAVVAAALAAFENANYTVVNENETTKEVKKDESNNA